MGLSVYMNEYIPPHSPPFPHHRLRHNSNSSLCLSCPNSHPNPPSNTFQAPSSLRQLPNKFPQIPSRRVLQILFQRPSILVVVSPLHSRQQPAVPVQSHQSRDQKFVAQLVFLPTALASLTDILYGVVQKEGVAGRAVDHAVEDVGYYFALGSGRVRDRGLGIGGLGGRDLRPNCRISAKRREQSSRRINSGKHATLLASEHHYGE